MLDAFEKLPPKTLLFSKFKKKIKIKDRVHFLLLKFDDISENFGKFPSLLISLRNGGKKMEKKTRVCFKLPFQYHHLFFSSLARGGTHPKKFNKIPVFKKIRVLI